MRKELGIKPVDDIMKQMGINDEDLESLNDEMMGMLDGGSMALYEEPDDSDEETDNQTATFPFLNKLFSGITREAGRPVAQRARKRAVCKAQRQK